MTAAGVIPLLVQILVDGPVDVQMNALVVLGRFASNAEGSAARAASGVIPPLVQLLGPESDPGQNQSVAWGLCCLVNNADNWVIMADAGVVPLLVELLGPDSSKEQELAACTLAIVAENDEIDATIAAKGATVSAAHGLLLCQRHKVGRCESAAGARQRQRRETRSSWGCL
jgi:hypothetical protein